MLVEFSVENYLSFRDTTTLSLMPTTNKELPENLAAVSLAGRKSGKVDLLKSVGFYGANASGKSNIIKALQTASKFIIESATKYDEGDAIPFKPFLLNRDTAEQPSSFEFTFIIDGEKYRYGFSADKKKIHDEWLYHAPMGRERLLFFRTEEEFEFGNSFKSQETVAGHTRENGLFVSSGSVMNVDQCKKVLQFFKSIVFYDPTESISSEKILNRLAKDETISIVSNLLRFADVGISHIEKKKIDHENLPKELVDVLIDDITDSGDEIDIKYWDKHKGKIEKIFEGLMDTGILDAFNIKFHHNVYENGTVSDTIPFNKEQESHGTIKYFALILLAIHALQKGGIIIIDEFDTSLHPELAKGFLQFFHKLCSKHSQFIFSTHNTELLDQSTMRRDQFWVVDKTREGTSELTPISDYKLRKDAVLRKKYLEGRLGGIPSLHHGYLDDSISKLHTLFGACKAPTNKETN